MSRVESGAKEGTVTVKMLVCCLLFAGYSFGQTSGGDSHKSTLIALERMWDRAQIAHDASALLNVVDDNFVNTEWDGSVSNKDQFLAAVKNPLVKVEVSQIETTQVTLHGNTAIVTGTIAQREIGRANLTIISHALQTRGFSKRTGGSASPPTPALYNNSSI